MPKIRRVDFSPDEWLAGTAELTAEERGIYITILALIYSAGGPIPYDLDWLRRKARSHPRTLARVVANLVRLGKLRGVIGESLVNDRAVTELSKASDRAIIGRSGAKKRWENNATTPELAMPPGNANHQPSTTNHQPSATTRGPPNGGDPSASVPDPTRQAETRAIVEALDRIEGEVFGEARRQQPSAKDWTFAARWRERGITAPIAEPIFRRICERRKVAGQDAPGSLAFFDRAISEVDASKPAYQLAYPVDWGRDRLHRWHSPGAIALDQWEGRNKPQPLPDIPRIKPGHKFFDAVEAWREIALAESDATKIVPPPDYYDVMDIALELPRYRFIGFKT